MKYLVDVGRIVPVNAVTPCDALGAALLDADVKKPPSSALVYELDQDGRAVIRVVPCQLEERKVAV